jgi:hypothetical protein
MDSDTFDWVGTYLRLLRNEEKKGISTLFRLQALGKHVERVRGIPTETYVTHKGPRLDRLNIKPEKLVYILHRVE